MSGLLRAVLFALFLFGGRVLVISDPPGHEALDPALLRAHDLNLPPDFVARARHRQLIDQTAADLHQVEPGLEPAGYPPEARFAPGEQKLERVRPRLQPATIAYRRSIRSGVLPPRSFRAPILDGAAEQPPASLDLAGLDAGEKAAAAHIQARLAFDGLLPTLATVLEIAGPEKFLAGPLPGEAQLARLGFPADWLAHFALGAETNRSPVQAVREVAALLKKTGSAAAVKGTLSAVPFRFVPSRADFRAAEETGEHEIGLLRLQAGGGIRSGVVRGGSIDVAGQMLETFPEADVIISVWQKFMDEMYWLALRNWPLHRPDRLTLVSEWIELSTWVQDNGKAGTVLNPEGGREPATITPRFASQNEIGSAFYPGESFLMDGVSATGHPVIQSPLLFQGGNLLVVRDPAAGKRILLLSETELHRNTPLGLTRDQVLRAFQLEFSVDQCVLMPVVSYHLDYDMTLRLHEGKIAAFVNDSAAAARIIVRTALERLESTSLLSRAAAAKARQQLAGDQIRSLYRDLHLFLDDFANPTGAYRASFVRNFAANPYDDPAFNFQCFLAALDLLASRHVPAPEAGEDLAPYFEALRTLQQFEEAQRAQLRELGWEIIEVPSMPDLHTSLNYLNGLHDRGRYIMPAAGGFYAPLDEAAAQVFRDRLGPGVEIVPINTSEIQQRHGGLHCAVAAYPRLQPPSSP